MNKLFMARRIGAGLVLGLIILLVACGETATSIPTTSNAVTVSTTEVEAGVASKKIVQPKVIRSASDSMRSSINFTEQPTLNDGVPTLLWFDAVG